jgi:hypothetical protein
MSPAYAAWAMTPKLIIALAFPIAGFVIGGENAALRMERDEGLKRSYVQIEGLSEFTGGNVEQVIHREARKISFDDLKSYILDNRYTVVGTIWASVVGGTVISLAANRNMPVSQKIITARMYAQASALTAFCAFALAANTPTQKRNSTLDTLNDRYFEATLQKEADAHAEKHGFSAEEKEELRERMILERLRHKQEVEARKTEHLQRATAKNIRD